jgi:hypothetical protein
MRQIYPKFTPKVSNMWGKCGGANVLPPLIPFTPKVPNMWCKCGGANVLPPNSIYP